MNQITLTDKQLSDMIHKAQTKRWLTKKETAQYIGVSVNTLMSKVKDGTIHKASQHLGYASPRWDKLKLDEEMSSGLQAV